VTKALDTAPIARSGQMFRMGMYHTNHPDGSYVVANRVATFEPPRAISWEPGQDVADGGEPQFGGWIWRYDLAPFGPSSTEVTSASTSRSRRSPWTTSATRCVT
jgi:hypothetical protein